MGYWNTTAAGDSLQPHDTGMLWGDAPADALDSAMEALITRLHSELGRWPTIEEVDSGKFGNPQHPEITRALQEATEVFAADVGRMPTVEELTAGLRFADTRIALKFAKKGGAE